MIIMETPNCPNQYNGIHYGREHHIFNIFINDFPSCLSDAFCNIFDDDTMVGVSDKSITKIQQPLQHAVNGLYKIS